MNEQEYHDLLIRLDTRQESIEARLKTIEESLSAKNCQTHAEKIRTLEKITWGALFMSLSAIVKSFWGVIVK